MDRNTDRVEKLVEIEQAYLMESERSLEIAHREFTDALNDWHYAVKKTISRLINETRSITEQKKRRLQCIKCGEECLDRGQDKTICGECA